MVYSAEIRWFFQTSTSGIPEKNLDWFKSNYKCQNDNKEVIAELKSEKTRDDYYLLFPQCESVGVKLREIDEKHKNNFEIKALLTSAKIFKFDHSICGKTDQWIKWSSDKVILPDVNDQTLWDKEKWIKITKSRFLRKFSIDSGSIKEIWAKEYINEGCNVEITQIEIESEPHFWFSLGFEAFGLPDNIHSMLTKTLKVFFQQLGSMPDGKLSIFNSLSYPAWLSTL